MKILIVDDDEKNRKLLEELMQFHGDLYFAEDGKQAVATFKKHLDEGNPFKFILMDINMPNLDGIEAIIEIRKFETAVYASSVDHCIIFMQTTVDDPIQMLNAYKKGKCNGYITKPIDADVLLDKMAKFGLATSK